MVSLACSLHLRVSYLSDSVSQPVSVVMHACSDVLLLDLIQRRGCHRLQSCSHHLVCPGHINKENNTRNWPHAHLTDTNKANTGRVTGAAMSCVPGFNVSRFPTRSCEPSFKIIIHSCNSNHKKKSMTITYDTYVATKRQYRTLKPVTFKTKVFMSDRLGQVTCLSVR